MFTGSPFTPHSSPIITMDKQHIVVLDIPATLESLDQDAQSKLELPAKPPVDLDSDDTLSISPTLHADPGKLSYWNTFLFRFCVGVLIFGLPGCALVALDVRRLPNLDLTLTFAQLEELGQFKIGAHMVRWSFFLSVVCASSIFVWNFLPLMPAFVVVFITRTYGFCSERMRERLRAIPESQFAIWWAATMILADVFFTILFCQFSYVPMWQNWLNILAFLTVFAAVLLCQRIAIMFLAIDFHRHSYRDRIHESKKSIRAVDNLRHAVTVFGLKNVFDLLPGENSMHKRTRNSDGNAFWKLFKSGGGEMHSEPSLPSDADVHIVNSATDEKEPTITRRKETIKSELSRKNTLNMDHDSATMKRGLNIGGKPQMISFDLLSERNGAEFANNLFMALRDSSGLISSSAFYPYFDTVAEAEKAFEIFDTDGNGTLEHRELTRSILLIYRERRNLMKSLGDLSQALGRLERVFYIFSLLISMLFSLPIFGISLTAILPFTSLMVALSFVFGSSAANLFNCIIFLFAHHPFDTGDRIIIEGQTFVVDELNLLNTIMTRNDGQKIYVPNNILSTKLIQNIRRSGNQSEGIDFHVSFSTTDEQLDNLSNRIQEFVGLNSRDFMSANMFILSMDTTKHIAGQFWLDYKGNWQNNSRRLQNRNRFYRYLRNVMNELHIQCELPALQVRVGSAMPTEKKDV